MRRTLLHRDSRDIYITHRLVNVLWRTLRRFRPGDQKLPVQFRASMIPFCGDILVIEKILNVYHTFEFVSKSNPANRLSFAVSGITAGTADGNNLPVIVLRCFHCITRYLKPQRTLLSKSSLAAYVVDRLGYGAGEFSARPKETNIQSHRWQWKQITMEKEFRASVTSFWVERNSQLYLSAIRAPFILSVRDGTLDHRFYTRWLGQDYLFVKEFCRFAASVMMKTPEAVSDDDMDILLGGLHALQEELLWFRSQSTQWNTRLDGVAKHETTESYCGFLKRLSGPDVKYSAALSTFWAIEMVYNESFATCLEPDANTQPELLEACQRWGSKGFKTYCSSLQQMADRALADAPPELLHEAEKLFQEVMKQEVAFWSMSFDLDGPLKA